MTALLVLLGIAAVLSLTAAAKVRIELSYREEAFSASAHLGPIPLHLPGEKEPSQPQAEKQQKPEKSGRKAPEKTDWKRFLFHHWRDILREIAAVLHRPTMALFQLEITAGGQDAADCALSYGRACAAVGAGLPLLRQAFLVQKEAVSVCCDYQQPKTTIEGTVVFTLRVWELLQLLLALTKWMSQAKSKTMKQKKGGAVI